ncbi:hypothetical protein D5F01_LYC20532 [Larimichthys crocea]|uniref:Uncharacterized protein n=1 Tax=Larimichthys crocea TaxID=215358 RepID=A0A6G0HQS2_LARCR|nr:hypothetical protein D5F01_LYC20532 [Larimichthys crocea]
MFSVRGRGRRGHQGERLGGVSGSEFRFKLQTQGETSAREQPDQARAQMQFRELSGPWQEQRYLETVSVRSMPTSHKIPPPPPPPPLEQHPLWNPNGCQFLRQPTADPFRPGNCCPAKEPKSPRGFDPHTPSPLLDSKMAVLAAYSGLGKKGRETEKE